TARSRRRWLQAARLFSPSSDSLVVTLSARERSSGGARLRAPSLRRARAVAAAPDLECVCDSSSRSQADRAATDNEAAPRACGPIARNRTPPPTPTHSRCATSPSTAAARSSRRQVEALTENADRALPKSRTTPNPSDRRSRCTHRARLESEEEATRLHPSTKSPRECEPKRAGE